MLDNHRNQLLDRIAIVGDGQQFDDLNWMFKKDLVDGLKQMGRKYGYMPQAMVNTDPAFEHAYFKNAGEKTPIDMNFLNKVGNFNAVRVPIYRHPGYSGTAGVYGNR